MSGNDTIIENVNAGYDTLISTERGGIVIPSNVERLVMMGRAYNAVGNELDNIIFGTVRPNNIYGAGGDDVIHGGLSNGDQLHGDAGDDVLFAESREPDRLWGGEGADRFVIASSLGVGGDRIQDFSRTQGDKINLRLLDADRISEGYQQFTFIGSDSFNDVAGELRVEGSEIQADMNGDGTADFYIYAMNASEPLTSSDFML